jgi:Domain of unknown function (DUF4386)
MTITQTAHSGHGGVRGSDPVLTAAVPTEPTPASTRTVAVLVGLLFLTATVTFIAADKLVTGVLHRSDYLTSGSTHTGALATGALLAFVQGIAIVAIAVLLFPLLKRHSERLAVAYVALRVTELAATLFYVATPLLAIKVADAVRHGTVDASGAHSLAALFQAQHTVAIVMIYLVTSVNGSILAYVLYRSKLVPRPIVIFGVIGYPVLMLGGILATFNAADVTHGAGLLASVPGGIFELIMPIWLIARGFTFPGSTVRRSATATTTHVSHPRPHQPKSREHQ